MTLDIYSHLIPALQEDTAERIAELLQQFPCSRERGSRKVLRLNLLPSTLSGEGTLVLSNRVEVHTAHIPPLCHHTHTLFATH